MADSSRRTAIAVLDQEAISFEDLVREVTELEATEPAADAIERTELSFRHVHLPMLEDAEVIRYGPETERIELLENERTNRLRTLPPESLRS
ncbi:hypothetical protein [Natrinema sp. 74]|uniref:DUF7344 domain-containing protein n=1 Tax=Natrinema sp. 74 TaxID=3384159 RepID=UPI0038D37C8A